jgi:hypothetical protein
MLAGPPLGACPLWPGVPVPHQWVIPSRLPLLPHPGPCAHGRPQPRPLRPRPPPAPTPAPMAAPNPAPCSHGRPTQVPARTAAPPRPDPAAAPALRVPAAPLPPARRCRQQAPAALPAPAGARTRCPRAACWLVQRARPASPGACSRCAPLRAEGCVTQRCQVATRGGCPPMGPSCPSTRARCRHVALPAAHRASPWGGAGALARRPSRWLTALGASRCNE